MVQREVVPHFVGDRLVQGAARLEFAHQSKGIVEHHDAVAGVVGGTEVGVALNAIFAIVAIDFRHHENVDVVVTIPGAQTLDRCLVCRVVVLTVTDAVLGIAWHAVAVDPQDAVGGLAGWGASRHLKLNEHVRTVAFAHAVAKVVIHALDGRQNLCVRDVLFHAHRRTAVNDVNHHG